MLPPISKRPKRLTLPDHACEMKKDLLPCAIENKPAVTIGICVRNAERTIGQAIESVIAQDLAKESMEVIFVDDSDDGTMSIIKGYASKGSLKCRIFLGAMKGVGHARNIVVKEASADYILWVDGDMILSKDYVREQVAFMKDNPKVAIAAGYPLVPEENMILALDIVPKHTEYLRRKSWGGNSKLPGAGGAIYRVETVREVGGFNDRIRAVGEDQDLVYRIKTAGWLVSRTKTVYYEGHGGLRTWRTLWERYNNYGYASYPLYRVNRRLFSPYKMMPIASMVAGLRYSVSAYRSLRRKALLILPIHFVFKMTAWYLGFVKGQIRYSPEA